MNNTRLGFKLLHPNQAGKEFDINFNFYLIDFWLKPDIKTFSDHIPDNMNYGEAIIIDNIDHQNHQQIIIFLNKHHLISPEPNMQIYYQQKIYSFQNNQWQQVK